MKEREGKEREEEKKRKRERGETNKKMIERALVRHVEKREKETGE